MFQNKPIIVAEFTTNHMGNLNVLLRMAEEAAKAGADIIKMQKKDVETFYSKEKLDSSYRSPYGKTYYDYRRIFEFGREDFDRFDRHCKELNIPWYTTIQDVASAEFFLPYHLPMIKIASCNTKNLELLLKLKTTFPGKPVVFSTGGTNLDTIDDLVHLFDGREIYIQQCTSAYPCPDDQVFLGNIPALKERFKDNPKVHVGYSGHEIGYEPTLKAVELGAEIIERHFCLSRDSFVHHIECSLEPDEFADMVYDIRAESWDFEPCGDWMKTNFGMKESEKKFLVTGAYGTDDLKDPWNK